MKLLPLPREKRRLLEPLGRAALTCLLTAGSFGGLCAPLPLAITAAAGPGLPGLCCVLGCGLGAFLFLPFQAGLRQLAAAILIFSGSIAFFDTKFFPRRFFRPGLAAALLLLVQSAYLIARPIRLWALCVFCMGLTAAVTDLLLRRRDRLPLLLAAGLCLSAGAFRIVGISVGMCLTCAFLMRSVRQMEPARGAAWGAAMGLCLGLLGDEPDLAPMAVLGLSCAALSRVRSAPAPVCIGTFWAIGGGCTLLFGTEEPLYRMIELFSGGILSPLPLPRLSLPPEKKRVQPEKPPRPDRLAKPAAALREKQHPAKRSFQAIRIAVNDELAAVREMMDTAPDKLRVGGRLCVISFHSLEDRIVKAGIARREHGCTCPREAPVCTCGFVQTLRSVSRKPILPGEEELASNPRARSAKLRVAERV
mgnify:CR=1 FL=1